MVFVLEWRSDIEDNKYCVAKDSQHGLISGGVCLGHKGSGRLSSDYLGSWGQSLGSCFSVFYALSNPITTLQYVDVSFKHSESQVQKAGRTA